MNGRKFAVKGKSCRIFRALNIPKLVLYIKKGCPTDTLTGIFFYQKTGQAMLLKSAGRYLLVSKSKAASGSVFNRSATFKMAVFLNGSNPLGK